MREGGIFPDLLFVGSEFLKCLMIVFFTIQIFLNQSFIFKIHKL